MMRSVISCCLWLCVQFEFVTCNEKCVQLRVHLGCLICDEKCVQLLLSLDMCSI